MAPPSAAVSTDGTLLAPANEIYVNNLFFIFMFVSSHHMGQ